MRTDGEANLEADDWTNPFVRGAGECPAFVQSKIGLYPSVFYKYRRIAPRMIERLHKEFRDSTSNKDAGTSIGVAQRIVFEHVTSWSFGELSRERIEQLIHPLLLKVFWQIMQSDPTDPIPEKYLPESEEDADSDEKK
jgi:hypothetical protein